MEVVHVVNESYKSVQDLKNVILYATNPQKTMTEESDQRFIGGFGVNPYEPEMMIQQMVAVKKTFHKQGGRQIRHIIVSFKEEWNVDPQIALYIAYEIAQYYGNRYQICFGIHQDTENIHIHFVMNTVSFIDGKKYNGGFLELQQLKAYVSNVVHRYYPRYCSKMQILNEFLADNIQTTPAITFM